LNLVERWFVEITRQRISRGTLTTDLLRRYARSLRGTRIGDHAPFSYGQCQKCNANRNP
jgi:hypothetical protein